MAKNQKLRKTILDLKKKILKLEEESGGRILKLRRLYNRMLQGGAGGFIPDIFKESFEKFNTLITFLEKQNAPVEPLKKCIETMETVVESIGKVTVQYSGPSIPDEVKDDLNKNKDKCHKEVNEALKKCFSGTEDKTAGYYYTKLMENSTDIDIQTQRESLINSYAELLKTNVKQMDKSIKEYRNTVSNKVQEYSSSDEGGISDEEVEKNFGETFEKHTNPKKGEGEKGEAKEGDEAPTKSKEGKENTEESKEGKEGEAETKKEGGEGEAPKELKGGDKVKEEQKKEEGDEPPKEGNEPPKEGEPPKEEQPKEGNEPKEGEPKEGEPPKEGESPKEGEPPKESDEEPKEGETKECTPLPKDISELGCDYTPVINNECRKAREKAKCDRGKAWYRYNMDKYNKLQFDKTEGEYNSSKRKKYGDRIIKFYKEMEELDSEWKKNSWWDRFCSDEYQLLKHDSELNNPPLINIEAPSPY